MSISQSLLSYPLNELHRELGRVFNIRQAYASGNSQANWSPQVDIKESNSAFTVIVDLPGLPPESIDVTLHDGVLTIKGERLTSTNSDEETFKRRERIRGTFFRQFSLPEATNEEAIKAKVSHGVIEITIPKADKPLPLSIVVESDQAS